MPTTGQDCAGCGAALPPPFHTVEAVPVHDTVLLPTREAALAFPTGDLRLALCRVCGLVQNTAFDEALLDYGADYEESQAFSPRFAAFTAGFVAGLVDRHGLHGGTVLEIGCGKGDFLDELTRATGGAGTGFDPAFVPGRLEPGGRWQVHARRFGEDDNGLRADLVCCRHTLEHVPDAGRLLRQLAEVTADSAGVLYVEVPDVLRVLREGAFWDLYYEHSTYFSAGSLGRLATRCGLRIDRLRSVFDGQYLALEARAGDGPSDVPEDLAELERSAESFAAGHAQVVQTWRERVAACTDRGEDVVVWGASSKAVGFLTALDLAGPGSPAVSRLVDVNPHKAGHYLPGLGQVVVAPAALVDDPPSLVVVMNPVYLDEIDAELARLGVTARTVTL